MKAKIAENEIEDTLLGDYQIPDIGVTEKLKAADQLAWIGAMNSIRNRAEEIVLRELIFAEDAV